jgi:hypothetical protein
MHGVYPPEIEKHPYLIKNTHVDTPRNKLTGILAVV